ncbi:hypothetical protein [Ruminococcus albus]|uniref:Uncharacterized protein n=1 Tax=Ruminococcus albus TaxID=1264 RepID=A0A1I1SB80_RUMAL|nr:hypothetical protein [Ruminococcus albus]SFD43759.1 hypothetical protein SAMN02910406_03878 [Ruminococcus albus]
MNVKKITASLMGVIVIGSMLVIQAAAYIPNDFKFFEQNRTNSDFYFKYCYDTLYTTVFSQYVDVDYAIGAKITSRSSISGYYLGTPTLRCSNGSYTTNEISYSNNDISNGVMKYFDGIPDGYHTYRIDGSCELSHWGDSGCVISGQVGYM